MTKYSKPNYCPEWFDLRNYDGLKDLDRKEWLMLIFSKHLVYSSLKKGEHKIKGYNTELDEVYIKMIYPRKREPSNYPLDIDDVISKYDFNCFIFDYETVFLNASKEQLAFLEELKKECENFSPTLEDIKNGIKPTDYVYTSGICKESIPLDNSHIFCINTLYSDETIIEVFKQKLSILRKEENRRGKRISDNEIESYIKYKVIPYIDLLLWSMLKDIKITDQKIADILFFDDPDGKGIDTLRQTTKKKALDLLNQITPRFI